MPANPLLGPAAVLILWTLIVLIWMGVIRNKAFKAAGLSIAKAAPGARYADVEAELPAEASWASHNYTHLMEQPTIFYAVIVLLAMAGDTSMVSLTAAWGYTLLRIAHSVWQIRVNIVATRVQLFLLSTICLWVLALRAVYITLL